MALDPDCPTPDSLPALAPAPCLLRHRFTLLDADQRGQGAEGRADPAVLPDSGLRARPSVPSCLISGGVASSLPRPLASCADGV